jgi:hypothetical protein
MQNKTYFIQIMNWNMSDAIWADLIKIILKKKCNIPFFLTNKFEKCNIIFTDHSLL